MARVGGFGRCQIFRLKSDHTAVQKADGTTAAALATDATLTFGGSSGNDILVATDFAYNDDGSVSIKLNQTKFDAAIKTFEGIFLPRKAAPSASDLEEIADEAGRKIGGSSGSGTEEQAILISYGAEGDDGKIPVACYPGFFKKTSGARSYQAGKWVAPQYEFQSVAAKADIDLIPALFIATIVTAPVADVTILTDYHEQLEFMTPAA
jgi:hypothetical protein